MDLLSANLKARKAWSALFQALTVSTWQPRFRQPTKLFTKIDEKVTFQGNEAIPDQSALQKIPKGILYREGKKTFLHKEDRKDAFHESNGQHKRTGKKLILYNTANIQHYQRKNKNYQLTSQPGQQTAKL